jgi:hypothetical protein
MPSEGSTPVAFRARVAEAAGARLALLMDGREVAAGQGSLLHMSSAPGSYRVEVAFPNTDVPWIVSNSIRIVVAATPPAAASPRGPADPSPMIWLPMGSAATDWAVEKSPTSTAAIQQAGESQTLRFELGEGAAVGQYAAMASTVTTRGGVERLEFVGRSDRPRRVSVQVRLAGERADRWRHSVYLDETPRRVSIRLRDFDPAERGTSLRPNVAVLQGVLFVVDTVNSAPGTSGTMTIGDVRLGLVSDP